MLFIFIGKKGNKSFQKIVLKKVFDSNKLTKTDTIYVQFYQILCIPFLYDEKKGIL